MKASNPLHSLFTDSQESLLEGTACQLYNGQWPMTKVGTVEKERTVLRQFLSSQIKSLKTKTYLLTLNSKDS